MVEYKKEHSREYIKAVPLAAVQEEFVTQAVQGKIDEAARDKLIRELEAVVPDDLRNNYAYEKRNVDAALQSGEAPHVPSVNLPETSLLWAINLAYLAQKKDDQNFYDSKLWKQFAGPDGAAQIEKERLAFYVATTGLNKETRVKWGELGSSFYYNLTDNYINLDLILGMGVGFDISRAAAFHEIGHSQLTKGFGEKIDALKAEINTVREQYKGKKIPPEEYLKVKRLEDEEKSRFRIADEAENNVVDRWTVNQGRRIRKDHVLARNATEAILVDGLIGDRELSGDTPNNRFRNVKTAIRYSFFRNNGYFSDTEEGWREIGVNPDWITTKDGKSGMEALEMLKELCGGKDGVENLQPNSSDMMMGAAKLAVATAEYSRRRNQRIEEIYDTFVDHIAQQMMDDKQKKREEKMEQKKQENQQPPEEQPPGEQQPGEGQSGEGDQSEGQDDGDPSEGKGQGKGKSQPGEGQGGAGDPLGDDDHGKSGGGGEEIDDWDVEGVGKMPGVKKPAATPQEEHNANKPGAGKPAEGADPDPGQTIEELEGKRIEREDRETSGGEILPPSSGPKSWREGFIPARGMADANTNKPSKPKVGDCKTV